MAKTSFTVIRGGRVLQGRRADAADILVEGDTIGEIGPPGLAAPEGATAIDARGRLLHPGLVNGHTHGHGGLAKGMGDRWTLELLLTAAPWIGGNRATEDNYLSTLVGAAEMLLKGCTAAYDLTFQFPTPSVEGLVACGQAYKDAGMRAVVAPMVADLTFYEAIPGLMEALPPALRADVERLKLAPYRTTLANMRKALKAWPFDPDVIRMAVAPTIPHHCSDAFLKGCLKLARDFGVGLHSHVSESKVQAVVGLQRYGKTLTAHLDDLGLVGPDFTVAHGVWLDADDMRLLGDRGASVAHNPGSNMRLGNGLADMRGMLDRKVNVAVGTDGSNCSDNQNLYEAMRLASMVSKVQGPDIARWVTTEEVLRAATEGSARALGLGDRLGRLAPGWKADIVFLDTGHVNWIPFNDAVNQIVHTEDGTGVHSVMVGGRMVVENRRLLTLDLADIARRIEAARARLEKANRPNKALYERLARVVGAFCPGLAHAPYHIDRYGGGHHDHYRDHRH
ncbi:MAG: amidohydrolase family protein [Alphaproteobacteria bacterium]|nr:amidohydrolase family protein [Alphaproteobacteria bacterium]